MVESKEIERPVITDLDLPHLEQAAAARILTLISGHLGGHHARPLGERRAKAHPQTDRTESRLKTNEIALGYEGLLKQQSDITERALVQSDHHDLSATRAFGAVERLIGTAGQSLSGVALTIQGKTDAHTPIQGLDNPLRDL